MFHVKNMSEEDFAFAIDLTDQMDWGLAVEDFEFITELEPEGCFVLLDDSERVGMVTNISFGMIGWLGNLIVNRNHQKKGAGSLLVKHSLQYLTSKNVKTVGLYAYMDKIPFYKRLGFQYDSDFAVFRGKGFSSPDEGNLRRAGKGDMHQIIDYDSRCFGASRRKLLEPILFDSDNLCYMSIRDGRISGYAVAKVYRGMAELGPLACEQGRSDIALGLLGTMLNRLEGLEVSMCVPERESSILSVLIKSGFSKSLRVARMFFGSPITQHCIHLAESLERG